MPHMSLALGIHGPKPTLQSLRVRREVGAASGQFLKRLLGILKVETARAVPELPVLQARHEPSSPAGQPVGGPAAKFTHQEGRDQIGA